MRDAPERRSAGAPLLRSRAGSRRATALGGRRRLAGVSYGGQRTAGARGCRVGPTPRRDHPPLPSRRSCTVRAPPQRSSATFARSSRQRAPQRFVRPAAAVAVPAALAAVGSMAPPHPLDPLSVAEVTRAAAAARAHGAQLGLAKLRFNTVTLAEPPKKALLAFEHAGGPRPPRRALCVLHTPPNADVIEALVALPADGAGDAVDNWKVLSGDTLAGQPLATPDDCLLAEAVVRADADVTAVLLERGIDPATLFLDPWAVHAAPRSSMRLIQVFCYLRLVPDDNEYAHPLDIIPWVDLGTERVVRIEQYDAAPPVPKGENGQYHERMVTLPFRRDLRKLHVVQPDGPSFSVQGNLVRWQHWSLRVGFNAREGLVLHGVSYDDPHSGGATRAVAHRLSIAELAVPYGDPRPPYTRKCALDAGDYGLGFAANSLALGCDCLGHVHYFDGVVNDAAGAPVIIKNAVCMHEEDVGLLWKHLDYRAGTAQSRRARRLVISFIMTAINYEYCFYWYFGLDGTIQFEVKLTGLLSTSPPSPDEPAGAPTHGTLVSPGVNAQHHQHFFCARLDLAVDDAAGGGAACFVSECEALPDEDDSEAGGPGNGFHASETALRTTHAARRLTAPERTRFWKVNNAAVRHPVTGAPAAYALMPGTCARLLARPGSAVARRAAFTTRNLWVTSHNDAQRYPAGEYVMQSQDCSGLSVWTAEDAPIEDPVVWYAFGVTHVVRPEDWPIMPCEHVGFTLKPWGFFHVNPSVDVPPERDEASKLHHCGCD